MKNNILWAALLIALGIAAAGSFIYSGMRQNAQQNRFVSVRGLSEREVPADKVTWPVYFKEVGNDLQALYRTVNAKNAKVVAFLKSKGLSEQEISVAAPAVIDLDAERYRSSDSPYRYNVTSVITVTSKQVDKVREMMLQQGELLQQGIAIASGDYQYQVSYEFTGLNSLKPSMIEEATKNAREAAEKFATDSDSRIGGIKRASQGLFTINDRDPNTPYIKKVRVVTSVDFSLVH